MDTNLIIVLAVLLVANLVVSSVVLYNQNKKKIKEGLVRATNPPSYNSTRPPEMPIPIISM